MHLRVCTHTHTHAHQWLRLLMSILIRRDGVGEADILDIDVSEKETTFIATNHSTSEEGMCLFYFLYW